MATENMEEGHESFTKISDFAKHLISFMPMFMSMSFFMGNFYQSKNETSNNLLHRNSLESFPRATVRQEKLNS